MRFVFQIVRNIEILAYSDRTSASAQKPGFCYNLGILSKIWITNPVSQTHAIAPLTQKPGFCDNLGILTKIWITNPVSNSHAIAPSA
ncbi:MULTISPECIES: hypothetical protein [Kamptonema]|uniref:hypothetical protein n=1 Tax=Kamptonema TaxID=1501433 RepID=UPI000318A6A7|nr:MULTISPECIES: hypothetical protein [Kamptonema]